MGEPPGTYIICDVCFWEEDDVQFVDPTYEGGANKQSLNEARRNFLAIGAMSEEFLKHVRAPRPDEVRETRACSDPIS